MNVIQMQANGSASLKEQAKAAASHPAKPALKASAAGDAAPSIAAAIAQNVSDLEGSADQGRRPSHSRKLPLTCTKVLP